MRVRSSRYLIGALLCAVGLLFFSPVHAQEAVNTGDAPAPSTPLMNDAGGYGSREVVATVLSVSRVPTPDNVSQYTLLARGEDGNTYTVNTALSFSEGVHYAIHAGDRVILSIIDNSDGTATAYLSDAVRDHGILIAFLFFAIVTIAVGLRRGLYALCGFAITIGILVWFVFPQILGGASPVLIAVIAGIGILAVNLYIAHGLTRSATIALLSTSFGVVLAWGIGALFVGLTKLSGLSTEESVFLYWQVGGVAVPEGLLLAGIILGTVGVLDDVAITQCETVAELKAANPLFTTRELFFRAMRVGRHHIASTVNTLVLAYAGSSLPLFLIFRSDTTVSFWRFLNTEAVAEEIVRTLAGTTALVLIVPVATAIAAFVWGRTSALGRSAYVHDEHR